MRLKEPFYSLDGIESNFISLYGEKTLEQKERYQKAFDKFKSIYDVECAFIASSSGRVEVCGNHTDHNGGKVVSCAISLDSLCFFMPRGDDKICLTSEGYPEMTVDLKGTANEKIGTSPALIRGVVEGFKNKDFNVGGFNAYITSSVLGGAGISSSASFEVLIAEILNFLYNDGKVSNEDKAKISQFSENVYFGKPSGLLDQTAIAFGGLKLLDFSSKESVNVKDINDNLNDFTLVLVNTGGSHADLTDHYASIPQEMKSVAKIFGKERLIEIDKDEFYKFDLNKLSVVSDRAILRAIHFFEENDRVDNLYESLSKKDYQGFIDAINQSGVSSLYKLQNCYVPESDEQLIPKSLAISRNFEGCLANRVHGGGFAGTILNIVKNTEITKFLNKANKVFGKLNVIPLKVRSVGTIVL